MKYKNIQTKESYTKLLKSGKFWEFYPELTGNWSEDYKIIKPQFSKEKWVEAIKVFNKSTFREKVQSIKNSEILTFELDGSWVMIDIIGMEKELKEEIQETVWFDFDGESFVNSDNLHTLLEVGGFIK